MMATDGDIERDLERLVAGLLGLGLAGCMAVRLWRWFSGVDFQQSVWVAIAGRPIPGGWFFGLWSRWAYGLWELSPGGQLAAGATIILIVALITGAILNWRWLYFVAGGVIGGGLMVNAYLMVKLMAAY